ncbi:T9SS type A sorting domain-containing protein [Algibacter sp. 2305UL17-15]|uniref:T9SS type A sorting domain-containing protein n=1 Tax=Algibacter sp. 2305UL17-15 TaxID=3231268 RepID=UPI0034579CA3
MKQFYSLLVILFFFLNFSYSQTTAIPDSNFEQALIDQNIDSDGIVNGQVMTSDISDITYLNVTFKNISDLSGIESFANLERLICFNNNLTSINVSNNSKLTYLVVSNNQLTSLDVSLNTILDRLFCDTNNLNCITANQNQIDNYSFSPLWRKDEKANYNLNCNSDDDNDGVINNMDLCPQTQGGLSVNEYGCNISNEYTFIPDYNFEQALIDLNIDGDGTINRQVLTSEISSLKSLDLNSKNIFSLRGIEDFAEVDSLNLLNNKLLEINLSNNANLSYLNVGSNKLTSVDITSNPLLENLVAYNNNISFINNSNNPNLTHVNVSSNQLTSLNLSSNLNLIELYCGSNQLNQVSVDSYPDLTVLNASNNLLTFIDVSQNSKLSDLNIANNQILAIIRNPIANLMSFNCSSNQLNSLDVSDWTNLITISADENLYGCITVSQNQFNNLPNDWLIHTKTPFAVDCSSNDHDNDGVLNENDKCPYTPAGETVDAIGCLTDEYITISDANFEQALIDLGVDSDGIINQTVFKQDIAYLTGLDVRSKEINDLSNIKEFKSLESLICFDNNLTSLDLSKNLNLKYLVCERNQLTVLNVKNGNNLNFINFYARENPNLACVQVDDPAWSNLNWTNIDEQTSFGLKCDGLITSIPDSNFEQALIDLSIDSDGTINGQVLTSDVDYITTLDVQGKNIADLTGVEDFVALTNLNCANNLLSNIDLANNLLLTEFSCNFNALSSINVTQNLLLEELDISSNLLSDINLTFNTKLRGLYCGNYSYSGGAYNKNTISSLDLSNNILLTDLDIGESQFTSIDLSNNPKLEYLYCSDNLLSELNLSNNTSLIELECANNKINQIDLSIFPNLQWIYIKNNLLTSFDISNNAKLVFVDCSDNLLEVFIAKNGFNSLIDQNVNPDYNFDATNNPDLTCIQVDDSTWSTTNWANIDPQTSFSEDCGVLWSSSLDDTSSFVTTDNDLDTFNWEVEGGGTLSKGFSSGGSRFFSKSWDSNVGNLTPDNLLITPTGVITIPAQVASISFSLNVEASNATKPAEHFAIYVFDEALGQSFDNKIHEETLTVGGNGSGKDINASIPVSFAGKNIGIIVRHYNTIGQDKLYVDDFEVSYEHQALSIEKDLVQSISVHPNPVDDILTINSKIQINKVEVYSILGNRVFEIKDTSKVNVSNLVSGLYLVKIFSGELSIIKKIIVE